MRQKIDICKLLYYIIHIYCTHLNINNLCENFAEARTFCNENLTVFPYKKDLDYTKIRISEGLYSISRPYL